MTRLVISCLGGSSQETILHAGVSLIECDLLQFEGKQVEGMIFRDSRRIEELNIYPTKDVVSGGAE